MQDTQENSSKLFVVHNIVDRLWAEWIVWQLQDAKYSTMMEGDFLPGSNLMFEREKALVEAERVIIILSPDYLRALLTETIWAAALFQDKSGKKGKLLPVLVRKCEPQALLGPIIPIDLVGLDEPTARDTLLAKVSRERKKPTASPPFPGGVQEAAPKQPRFPGYLPPIRNIPPYNPLFTNREHILDGFYDRLKIGKAGFVHIHTIGGLGGIGKTQTALAYAYQHSHNYQALLWVNADKRETLVEDLVNVANLLGLLKKNEQDRYEAITNVKRWLEDHADWLLILDDLEDSQTIKDFIPSVGNGHILLTTRAQAAGTIAQSIELDKMTPEDGALFLLRRAKIIGPDATLDDASATDRAVAWEISQTLSNLPLALDQAGAYIEEASCRLEDYLNRYQKQRAKLLKRRGGITSDHPSDHPESVADTWSLDFRKIQQTHPAAIKVLQLCAFLHPDTIPEEIITEGLPEIGDELDDAIAELRKFSLVHRNATTRTLTIPCLVQTVLRDEMDEHTQHQWSERAVQAVNHVFPNAEPVKWEHCQRYFSHVQVCATFIEQWKIELIEARQLLYRMGCHLHTHAQYAQTEPLFIQALSIWGQTLGSENYQVAKVLENYASLLRKIKGEVEAAELETRAMTIQEKQAQENLLQ